MPSSRASRVERDSFCETWKGEGWGHDVYGWGWEMRWGPGPRMPSSRASRVGRDCKEERVGMGGCISAGGVQVGWGGTGGGLAGW